MNGRIAPEPYAHFDIGRKIRWSSGQEISFRSNELGFHPGASPAAILGRAGSEESIAEVSDKATDVLAGGGKETERLLYLIVPEGEDEVCKVGIAQRPLERLCNLQVACWKKLSIAGLFCPIKGSTVKLESLVHARAKRAGIVLNGEWLKLSPEGAAALVMATANRNSIRLCGPDVWTENLAARVRGLRQAQIEMKRSQEERLAQLTAEFTKVA